MINIIKRFLREDIYFYSLLLILMSVVSFGLGRVSMIPPQEAQQGNVILTKQPVEGEYGINMSNVSEVQGRQLVGSKNGSKYHALWCPGASQIKEANKVFFTSEADAQAKGYTQAGNCDM